MNKQFIVKKYVMAKNAQDALRKERSIKPDDVWIDEEWKKINMENVTQKDVGFTNKHEKTIRKQS